MLISGAVAMIATADDRIPASTTGSATGTSTLVSSCTSLMPIPRPASWRSRIHARAGRRTCW